MKALHDTRKTEYREPFGAVNCGEKVTLRVEVDREFAGSIKTRLWIENLEKIVEMTRISENIFEAEFVMPEISGIVWYFFIVQGNGMDFFVGNNMDQLGGIGMYYRSQPPSFQITVSSNFVVPKWVQNKIMYQIFPDSFCNGNEDGRVNSPKKGSYIQGAWDNKPSYHKDSKGRIVQWGFFGGNLKGITSKLDYIAGLGVGLIYLNPIFEAASPHRYDTGDYMKIDGVLGTLADFDELIAEAKKRDIRIMLDGVFNHTGADSIYFNKKGKYNTVGAYNSTTSNYYKWYSFKTYPEKYESWWDVDDLPNVNENDESFIDFIYKGDNSVIRYWVRRGVMGFRLDVADELPEDFIRGIRKTLEEENPEAFLIGEVWEDASNKVSYGKMRNYFGGDQLHSVMNYPFYNGLIDFSVKKIRAEDLKEIMMGIYENYPKQAILSAMNLIGSHDRPRILTRLNTCESKDEQQAIKRLKMISAIQMALPGIPSIYYGDEAGMEGEADPYNRATYPWGKENTSILEWYYKITKIRNSQLLEMLTELPEISYSDDNLLLLTYINSSKEVNIIVNNDENNSKRCELINKSGEGAAITELLYGVKIDKVKENSYILEIPPLTTLFLVTLSQ
ncbi:MAG: glycoside hydrolase family 13 protein [Peptostreptococcaceae bacterium]|nr:glycoside hydrolase family 13 protein [Peptostreptococcaceae bacterium]